MNFTNTKLSDVRQAFDAIPKKGRDDKFGGKIKADGDLHTHIQGVAPYQGVHFLTHSDADQKTGRLLVVNRAPDNQNLLREIRLPVLSSSKPFYFHPGGCQLIGDCLVIPVSTENGASFILFFDVSDPQDVRELDVTSRITRGADTGAVGITNVTRSGVESWLLCAYHNGTTVFYESDGRSFPRGFRLLFSAKLKEEEHQAFCLLTDTSNHVFAVGLNKTFLGQDTAVLYEIDLVTRTVNLVEQRKFEPTNARLRWGASVEIVSSSELALFCTGRRYGSGCHINRFDSRTPSLRATARRLTVKSKIVRTRRRRAAGKTEPSRRTKR